MYRSDKPVKAIIRIKLGDDLLESVGKALKPETETPSSERSNTVIDVIEGQIVLETDANDVSALRANLNSYLRWVEGIQGIVDSLE